MGIDESPVKERLKQQLSRMGSLTKDTDAFEEVMKKIRELASDVDKRIKKQGVSFRTLSVTFIDSNLRTHTRSKTVEETDDLPALSPVIESLTKKYLEENPGKAVRRVGIGVSSLIYGEKKERQKTLSDY